MRLLAVTWSEAGLPALIVEKASGDFRTLDDLMQKKKLGSADKVELLDSIMEGLDSLHVRPGAGIIKVREAKETCYN